MRKKANNLIFRKGFWSHVSYERITEIIDLISVMQLIYHKILLDKLIQIGLAEEPLAQIESWMKTHKAKVMTNSLG